MKSAQKDSKKLVSWLVAAIVAVLSVSGCMPALHDAAIRGDVGAVRSELEAGADVNAKAGWGFTPLHWAAVKGHLDVVRFLVENGADVNTKARFGSPLHQAAAVRGKGHLDVVRFLVENGADVNSGNWKESTPLHLAAGEPAIMAGWGSLDVVRFLVENGADVNAKDNLSITPLHWAAGKGSLDVVRFLVENGADVNAKDNLNSTPLHWVAAAGLIEHVGIYRNPETYKGIAQDDLNVVRFLIENGADVVVKDNNGQTPMDWAEKNGNEQIAALLKKAMKGR